MEEMRNVYKILIGDFGGRAHLGYLLAEDRIKVK
jgi:hypothetical protein